MGYYGVDNFNIRFSENPILYLCYATVPKRVVTLGGFENRNMTVRYRRTSKL